MSLNIDPDVNVWLITLAIIKPQRSDKAKTSAKIQLDAVTSKQFMDGFKVADLLKVIIKNQINQGYQVKPLPFLNNLKEVQSPGVKLFNWNLISDAMAKMNMPLDPDIKSNIHKKYQLNLSALIVQGDSEMMNELLKDIYLRQKPPSPKNDTRQNKTEFDLGISSDEVVKAEVANTVSLSEIDPNKSLSQTKSLLEFYLVGLARHLKIKPKQTVQLLSQNNKLLSHILVKGFKNNSSQLVSWLTETLQSISQAEYFLSHDPELIERFLSTIRSGLISKFDEIAEWTIRIYQRVIFDLVNVELLKPVYQWFTMEHGGLFLTFMTIHKHPQMQLQICEIYAQISKFNINDFFNVQFRKILKQGKEFLDIVNMIFEPLLSIKQMKEEVTGSLLKNGLIEFWGNCAIKLAENELKSTLAERIAALKYLTLYWIHFPPQFEQNETQMTQFLFLMKKGARERSPVFKVFVFQNLFRLLDHLAAQRDPYAALIYKKLTFSMIENFNEPELKEFLTSNMIYIMKKYPSIPIDILIAPFIKQIQLKDKNQVLTIGDIQVLRIATVHPKLDLLLAIQMMDILSRIYLSQIAFASISFSSLQLLLAKYIENEAAQEFCYNLAKTSLALFMGSYETSKKKSLGLKQQDFAMQQEIMQEESDRQRMAAQQRAQVLELIKFMVTLRQYSLSEQLKQIVVHFYLEVKKSMKLEHKGLVQILGFFGSLDDVIKEVEVQNRLDEKEKRIQLQIQSSPSSHIFEPRKGSIENEFLQDTVKSSAPLGYGIKKSSAISLLAEKKAFQSEKRQLQVVPKISEPQKWKGESGVSSQTKIVPPAIRIPALLPKAVMPMKRSQASDEEILGNLKLNDDEKELMRQFEFL